MAQDRTAQQRHSTAEEQRNRDGLAAATHDRPPAARRLGAPATTPPAARRRPRCWAAGRSRRWAHPAPSRPGLRRAREAGRRASPGESGGRGEPRSAAEPSSGAPSPAAAAGPATAERPRTHDDLGDLRHVGAHHRRERGGVGALRHVRGKRRRRRALGGQPSALDPARPFAPAQVQGLPAHDGGAGGAREAPASAGRVGSRAQPPPPTPLPILPAKRTLGAWASVRACAPAASTASSARARVRGPPRAVAPAAAILALRKGLRRGVGSGRHPTWRPGRARPAAPRPPCARCRRAPAAGAPLPALGSWLAAGLTGGPARRVT